MIILGRMLSIRRVKSRADHRKEQIGQRIAIGVIEMGWFGGPGLFASPRRREP
ncbi:hypothetical protein AB0M02_40695 [Actinoplanes sp. NPDC051861]|uniref:hypothetical protein n=1 Tax=Actinoplanes sp. NPDC051861 TaxID=3155170 RepID=UPI00342A543F